MLAPPPQILDRPTIALRASAIVPVEQDVHDDQEAPRATCVTTTPNTRKTYKGQPARRCGGRLRAQPREAPEIFQSITSIPAYRGQSFEELRLECYRIATLTTGRPPRAVPPNAPSSMIIPPLCTPYVHVPDDDHQPPALREVTMSYEPNLCARFTFAVPSQ
ncbi:hypothetical protein A0H81_10228 [Grifola frondosa]|uniref:Uncharacterized protein n=1 Tax=Grifola frondosa TaxID=5627 RepID=A0A1C7LZY5_GRIFR|nr:hypothetical protein A0H81_10228 [Grifola frondosa]